MSHTTQWPALLTFFLLATLSGCGGGGNGDGSSNNSVPPEPPVPAQTEFTTLVRDVFATTADDADPIALSELDLLFSDEDNLEAFNELLE